MLELYSASAGSGKTYTLAKKYIWYYITLTPEGGKPRLRTDAELADSARHILAVTFTNKATNEMQMRIVKALFELHTLKPVWKTDSNGNPYIKKPDYMQDFTDELGVTPEKIAEISGKALNILLEGYSDFNVSTIDSFFQQVLRTFAYESEINDNYQVELDGEYLSQVSVDATLEDIDTTADRQKNLYIDTPFWINKLIDRTDSKKWNIFNRNLSSKTGENPYRDFIHSVGRMQNEEYKRIRDDVERYFRAGHDMRRLYTDLAERYEEPVRRAFKDMRAAFRKFSDTLPDDMRRAGSNAALGKFNKPIRMALDPKLKWDTAADNAKSPVMDASFLRPGPVRKWLDANPDEGASFVEQLDNTIKALDKWKSLLTSPGFAHWRLYSVNLPFFALFNIVTRKRQEYLDETGALELGETSMILRGVIGDSDTPFIYERLGTRLNHFLIDEFQDTSGMQWEILKPLLDESISRANGNLIIGDAKQSIYRFRNANPSLITTTVPAAFAGNVKLRGNIPSENTNYRSYLRVVEFNNSFFEYLVRELDKKAVATGPHRKTFGSLYGNVVQTPADTDPKGYVEVRMVGDSKKKWSEHMLPQIPRLIERLIGRGYMQKEIAILVQRHSEGEEVIAMLNDYNANRPEGSQEIRFVSEQSLKVSSSRAVNIITGVLDNIARGSKPEIREGEETHYKGVCTWNEVAANFKYFSMKRPDEPLSERLEAYFNGGANFDALTDLLGKMQSLAIPALVEAIAATFVSKDIRRQDAVYLAAFQDLVLEYCESHPTDIGSFLKWWARKSRSVSISSPENTDAVQIVTVHKSKGLQYACVIVPYGDWDLGDAVSEYQKEWRWVQPQVISHPSIPLPDYIPIETSKAMQDTVHSALLDEYYDQVKMDRLNSAYVAFTRAKKELYIFCTASGAPKIVDDNRNNAPKTTVGTYLFNFLSEATQRVSTNAQDPRLPGDVISDSGMQTDEIGQACIVRIGSPASDEEIREGREELPKPTKLETYASTADTKLLKYRSKGLPQLADNAENAEESESEEDIDPRSEGNLKHAVLELVKVPEDLPHAVKHLCLTGVIPESLAPGIESSLREALGRPEIARWFDGSARVITERPMLKKGNVSRRPDRLLIYPDNTATVVDYKFGKIDKSGKYQNQIRNYIYRLSETGQYHNVRGYLWYVNENRIEEVRNPKA